MLTNARPKTQFQVILHVCKFKYGAASVQFPKTKMHTQTPSYVSGDLMPASVRTGVSDETMLPSLRLS